ncbi:NF-kappa-B inhibitor cactus-like [Mizuhopecten yessoensis]|uniref:NF-kappa-B inhibitor cactus n=1 Tax=Mizuhopecten yessoensis TaxID=6573 RepID=A0A210PRW2_MIZYE|nr:NF-kappa-B inhibitor cactus-like [Mizuhopecten yessoensis]OWF39192.1 NF-kappa-B inhibitor cactus [Mizuhopecten yessoensis]
MNDLETDGERVVRPSLKRMDHLNKLHEKDMENSGSLESGYGSAGSMSFTSGDVKSLREEVSRLHSNSMGGLPEQCESITDNTDVGCLSDKINAMTVTDDEGFTDESPAVECEDRVTPEALMVYGTDSEGDNLLFLAIINGQISLANVIIQMAPAAVWLDIYNDKLRQTALHLAVLMKQASVVRRLVVGGACLEMCDRNGDTPLHIACRQGDMETVNALLEPVRYEEIQMNEYSIRYQRIPQNLEVRNSAGCTCIHDAAENGHMNIMKMLLSKGAQINNGDAKRGATVLHRAAERGDLSLTAFLLGLTDINVDSKMYDGATPAVIAYGRRHGQIVDILKRFGAKTDNLSDRFEIDDDSDSDV